MEHYTALKRRLGYLSAAPRISTRPDAENGGPRTHILSFIRACETLGWEVKPFIAGDRVPRNWVNQGSERAVTGGFVRTLAVDIGRIIVGSVNVRRAWRELGGQVDWVYERYGAFRSFGWIFKRHGIPWILETNAPNFYEAKTERRAMALTGLARLLELQAYRKCDALICVSEALKELVVNESGIAPEKVVVVPNGVDTDLFNPERHEPKRLFAGFTVGFVGRLLAWQGLNLLLEVIRDLRAEGLDFSVVVVGDGVARVEWETQAQTLGIASNVAFVGRVLWSEVPQYIAGFDVGFTGHIQLQVGKMYHSPLKLYEYMAMAKPVVASAFEDAQRVIQEGETGFLFEPGNKEDLKRALTCAYKAKAQLTTIGQQARQVMLAQHSWVTRLRAMASELEQILGDKPA